MSELCSPWSYISLEYTFFGFRSLCDCLPLLLPSAHIFWKTHSCHLTLNTDHFHWPCRHDLLLPTWSALGPPLLFILLVSGLKITLLNWLCLPQQKMEEISARAITKRWNGGVWVNKKKLAEIQCLYCNWVRQPHLETTTPTRQKSQPFLPQDADYQKYN